MAVRRTIIRKTFLTKIWCLPASLLQSTMGKPVKRLAAMRLFKRISNSNAWVCFKTVVKLRLNVLMAVLCIERFSLELFVAVQRVLPKNLPTVFSLFLLLASTVGLALQLMTLENTFAQYTGRSKDFENSRF